MTVVRLGDRVFTLSTSLLSRSLATARMRPGSEWHELVVHASLASPERWGGPPHGDPRRWDWGATAYSLGMAMNRYAHLERLARNLTPDQRDALWSDPSPEAAAV